MAQVATRTAVKINGFSLQRPRLTPVILALVLVSLLSLLFVWSRIHAINLEYSVSSLEREIRVQQKEIKELSMETAFLSRDERVAGLAHKYLGMRAPAPGQTIWIE